MRAYADPVAQRRIEHLEDVAAHWMARVAERDRELLTWLAEAWDEGHAARDLPPDEWVNPHRKLLELADKAEEQP